MRNLLSLNYVCFSDYAVEPATPPLLCGKVSRDIRQEIEKLTANSRVKKLRWFSECLSVSITGIKCEYFPFSQHESLQLFSHIYMYHSNSLGTSYHNLYTVRKQM